VNTIYIATFNKGKLRDFAAAAEIEGVRVESVPGFANVAEVKEDGETFSANARKKAEHYSLLAPGNLVLADDSGLEVAALGGAPGVRSARYAADSSSTGNADDNANNRKLLAELDKISEELARAQFVAVIAAAVDGKTVAEFRGQVQGAVIDLPREATDLAMIPCFSSKTPERPWLSSPLLKRRPSAIADAPSAGSSSGTGVRAPALLNFE
jgi:XTP/dITP diphosphohydrolase